MAKCKHKPCNLTYVQWHLDAEKRLNRGEKVEQCPVCKLWVWEKLFK
jgi:hypothetical protein